METIDLYDALKQMNELSKDKIHFSFSFVTFEKANKSSKGVRKVKKAILTKKSTADVNERKDIMQNYKDLSDDSNKQFYSHLLLTFNNKKVILK